jgi:dCMP deaminase
MSDHHKWMMGLAFDQAKLSPDPSTKVGALIVSHGKIHSLGHNHIPKRIPHTPDMLNDREWKYPRIIHAEQDAMSQIGIHKMQNPVMYVTHHPCERCAAQIIHAGFCEVFTMKVSDELWNRWPGMKIAAEMFLEAKIPVKFLEF